jgi:hypothetical protein
MSSPGHRSVKIGNDERGGWSSDRPRRPGTENRPPRKQDVGVRGRVLAPTDRLRYSPGSLLVVVCPDRAARDRFIARALEEQSALLSLDKVRALLAGKVAAEELEAKAAALLDAAASKRLAAGQTVVIAADGLTFEERDRYVRLAAAHRRPRHLLLLEAARDAVADSDRAPLTDLRTKLDAGELGAEGFSTSLRLGGRTVDELKRIVFAPPPSDD